MSLRYGNFLALGLVVVCCPGAGTGQSHLRIASYFVDVSSISNISFLSYSINTSTIVILNYNSI